ncbi:peptidase M16 family protein [Nitzschia inconspicua]|uniref:Peptidase M16 family protein n=1 Tax=Nitzschia inconspicua TaxID=303405 RepID=A0A9K3L063_9STRA|nr:peptidase M16 family protein [Nitzschia inconspicua]
MLLSRSARRATLAAVSTNWKQRLLNRTDEAIGSRALGSNYGIPMGQRASFSANSSASPVAFDSPYEYPTRKEAPLITTTKATDVMSTSSTPIESQKVYIPEDPFDDKGLLSTEEKEKLKEQQSQKMRSVKLSSLPITKTIPNFVPPNVPSRELEAPETLITTLDNGIRVVSQELYSQMCTVGVLTNVGSRHEDFTGTIHCLETMSFGSTKQYDGLEITQLLQDWGATRFVSHSREQTLHCIDILRPNVNKGMGLLSEVVLNPLISESPVEVEYAKEVMQFQAQEQIPELNLAEALQVAAYGVDQQLGKLHFATPESIPFLNAALVEDFYQKNIRNNPKGMVVAGAGIEHNELVDMTKEYFGNVEQQSGPLTIPSKYRGGSHFIETHSSSTVYQTILPEKEQCKVALAFPVGGWHSDSMVTACVLQALLGGGSSFSAGGPGKGMYSRMYQQVLNKYGWIETAEAFTTFAEEEGLFGVSAGTASPENVPELVKVIADQLARIAVEPVGGVELSRARNMLKCNILTQLESRLIVFEDMGRQILTYGKIEDAASTCQKIDSVTGEDVQKLVQDMLQKAPTLAATGSYINKIPRYEQVCNLFR